MPSSQSGNALQHRSGWKQLQVVQQRSAPGGREQEILDLVALLGICYLGHDKRSTLNCDVEHGLPMMSPSVRPDTDITERHPSVLV